MRLLLHKSTRYSCALLFPLVHRLRLNYTLVFLPFPVYFFSVRRLFLEKMEGQQDPAPELNRALKGGKRKNSEQKKQATRRQREKAALATLIHRIIPTLEGAYPYVQVVIRDANGNDVFSRTTQMPTDPEASTSVSSFGTFARVWKESMT